MHSTVESENAIFSVWNGYMCEQSEVFFNGLWEHNNETGDHLVRNNMGNILLVIVELIESKTTLEWTAATSSEEQAC